MWRNFVRWPGAAVLPAAGRAADRGDPRSTTARMRLPYRDELNQPAGVVHGGAIATLIDTVVVPAVASAYDEVPRSCSRSP